MTSTDTKKICIAIKTNDDACFTIDHKLLKFSTVLNEMISILGEAANHKDDEEPIHLEHISKLQMEKVIAWCDYHFDNSPMEEEELDRIINVHQLLPWDREFLRVDTETLLSIANAANFLDIKPMMKLICKGIALHMRGMRVMDVFIMFNFFRKRPHLSPASMLQYANEFIDDMPHLTNGSQESSENKSTISDIINKLLANQQL